MPAGYTLLAFENFNGYTIGASITTPFEQKTPAKPFTAKVGYWANPTTYAQGYGAGESAILYPTALTDALAEFVMYGEYGITNILARQSSANWRVGACYRGEISKNGIRIYRADANDNVTQLAYAAHGGGYPSTWAFGATGTTLTVTKNGVSHLTTTDATYASGKYGFGDSVGGDYARIDDAAIYEKAASGSLLSAQGFRGMV